MQIKSSRSGGKVEPTSNKASPAGAAQLGAAVQFRKEPLIQKGQGYNPAGVGDTGIPGKYNSATQGPGSQRTTYASGSQSTYGPVNPGQRDQAPDVPATRPGRDILRDFGPEKGR